MKLITTLLILAFCSVAIADVEGFEALAPDNPAVLGKCDGTIPNSIIGRWQVDFIRTENERTLTGVEESPNNNQSVSNGASVMTITENSMISQVANVFDIEVPYRLIGGSANRYLVEPYDELGAGDAISLTLIPCGMKLEGVVGCDTGHCKRVLAKVYAQIAEKMGISREQLEASAEMSATEQPGSTYYRLLGPDTADDEVASEPASSE